MSFSVLGRSEVCEHIEMGLCVYVRLHAHKCSYAIGVNLCAVVCTGSTSSMVFSNSQTQTDLILT